MHISSFWNRVYVTWHLSAYLFLACVHAHQGPRPQGVRNRLRTGISSACLCHSDPQRWQQVGAAAKTKLDISPLAHPYTSFMYIRTRWNVKQARGAWLRRHWRGSKDLEWKRRTQMVRKIPEQEKCGERSTIFYLLNRDPGAQGWKKSEKMIRFVDFNSNIIINKLKKIQFS